MLIDTTDSQFEAQNEILKQELIRKKLEKGQYTAEDIAIVRVTDHLPENNAIPSTSNVPFVAKPHNVTEAVADLILEEQGITGDERDKIMDEMIPFSTEYRSTVHCCLNGVVSSHARGNFDNNTIVVIDPFINHESDENLEAVRCEDTYFKEGIQLHDAIVLVDEKESERVLDSNIGEHCQVIFYRGDRNLAAERILLQMGIVPESINEDRVNESPTSSLLISYIKSKGYSDVRHSNSSSYISDITKELVLYEKHAENFYTYLYAAMGEDIEAKRPEILELASGIGDYFNPNKLLGIVRAFGVDNYAAVVKSYNSSTIEKIASGEYPNNNQILGGASLEFEQKHQLS